jgi:hypothetical protein
VKQSKARLGISIAWAEDPRGGAPACRRRHLIQVARRVGDRVARQVSGVTPRLSRRDHDLRQIKTPMSRTPAAQREISAEAHIEGMKAAKPADGMRSRSGDR